MDKHKIIDHIYDINDLEDLDDIWEALKSHYNHIRDLRSFRAKDKFRVGMEVRFRGNRRSPGPHTGIIEKKMGKTMKVNIGFQTWTIPYCDESIKILKGA
jgi:hypothetical protein